MLLLLNKVVFLTMVRHSYCFFFNFLEHANTGIASLPTQDYKLNKSLQFIRNEIPNLDISTIRKNLENFQANLRGKPEHLNILKQIEDAKLNVANLITEEEVVYFYEKLIRYYNIINRNLSDTVPKIIATNMVLRYFKDLEDFFQKTISESMDQLNKVDEDPGIDRKRETYKETLTKLVKSKEILQRFHFEMEN